SLLTLFPYTTLFRSLSGRQGLYARAASRHAAAGRVEVPGPADHRAASEKPGESELFRAGADVPLHRQPDVLGCEDDRAFREGLRSEEHTSELQSLRH